MCEMKINNLPVDVKIFMQLKFSGYFYGQHLNSFYRNLSLSRLKFNYNGSRQLQKNGGHGEIDFYTILGILLCKVGYTTPLMSR